MVYYGYTKKKLFITNNNILIKKITFLFLFFGIIVLYYNELINYY